MANVNNFLKPTDEYQRNVNPISQYVEQSSHYLSTMTGKPIEECRDFIVKGIRSKSFEGTVDPIVTYFERGENQDREEHEGSLSNYISSITTEEQILTPTFTTYLPTKQRKSLLVGFIDGNVVKRSIAKKASFVAKAEGKTDLYIAKNNEQSNMKTYNNSLSGAFAAGGSIVNNPTAHSTLTSITRTFSSLSNASNERIIAGNRHYRDASITLDNLISICSNLDRSAFIDFMVKYNIHYPTIQETMDCITYSTDLYWNDYRALQTISDYVSKMLPVERAAVMYTGDLFHLRKYNEQFIREFLTKLSKKVTDVHVEEPLKVIKNLDEQIINYVHQICMEDVRGIGKDYSKVSEKVHQTIAATGSNIEKTVEDYKDFIKVIFLTDNLPPSTAYIYNMIRRTVVLSDTDSTMFAVDNWVIWYFNELIFTEQAYALAGAIMFVATQCIAHSLAVFSANMNVERAKIHMGAMKPEFVFSVLALTSVAKHYYTSIVVKEGNVYKEEEMEIKGVHLKSSAAPQDLVKDSQAKMKDIIKTITDGKKISILKEIRRVVNIEMNIKNSLLSGKVDYYKASKIKTPDAYAGTEEESPYQHHILWREVFGDKYGVPEEPPYTVIKIPTTLSNRTALKRWLDTIPDRTVADKLIAWTVRKNKSSLPTLYVSKQYVQSYGIPAEIIPVIDFKRIILDLTITDRMVLESLGYFVKKGWILSELGYDRA